MALKSITTSNDVEKAKKMNYENRVCCFLDFLGFKEIVEKTTINPSELDKIIEAINMAREHFEIENPGKRTVVTQFSDSIVVSFPYDTESEVFYTLNDIQMYLARLIYRGYIVRGGISLGPLVHTTEILIGPAMIDAYELESKIAKFPRVILSKDVYELGVKFHASHHLPHHEIAALNEVISEDKDQRLFVDYFGKNIQNLDDPEYDFATYADALKTLILAGISHIDKDVRDKYEWAKIKYNEMICSWDSAYWEFKISDDYS